MKKRLFSLLLVLLLCTLLALPVLAAQSGHPLRLIDNVGLLSSQEKAKIIARLDSVSEENDFDVAILLAPAEDVGNNLKSYADRCYVELGYGLGSDGESGILLVISPDGDYVDYAYTIFGDGSEPFDSDAFDTLDDAFLPDLRERDYLAACLAFADTCGEIVQSSGINYILWIVISLVAGALLSFLIPMSVLKGQLKSVRAQSAASNYVRDNSMILTQQRDLFLYRNVTRTPRPKNNSGSGSGGSSSHSGSRGGRSGRV